MRPTCCFNCLERTERHATVSSRYYWTGQHSLVLPSALTLGLYAAFLSSLSGTRVMVCVRTIRSMTGSVVILVFPSPSC